MARFDFNNAKNASTGYTLFKLNCGSYQSVFLKKTQILTPIPNQKMNYE